MRRSIVYSEEFDKCVGKLGGYRAIDEALDLVIDGLSVNPFGFEKFESDMVSFRYARTKPIGVTPALYVIFTIESRQTVVLQHVEEVAAD